jgi:hypothetical protein
MEASAMKTTQGAVLASRERVRLRLARRPPGHAPLAGSRFDDLADEAPHSAG